MSNIYNIHFGEETINEREEICDFYSWEEDRELEAEIFDLENFENFIKHLNNYHSFKSGIIENLTAIISAEKDEGSKDKKDILEKYLSDNKSDEKVEKMIIAEINKRLKNINAEILDGNLENWIQKDIHPEFDEKARENIYKLCFAFDMDHNKTAEFFMKSYWNKPFNYKNSNEAIYLFCLKNKLGYQKAEALKEELKKCYSSSKGYSDDVNINGTNMIGSKIIGMTTEKELLDYIVLNNRYYKNDSVKNNATAIKNVSCLIDKCCELYYELDALSEENFETVSLERKSFLLKTEILEEKCLKTINSPEFININVISKLPEGSFNDADIDLIKEIRLDVLFKSSQEVNNTSPTISELKIKNIIKKHLTSNHFDKNNISVTQEAFVNSINTYLNSSEVNSLKKEIFETRTDELEEKYNIKHSQITHREFFRKIYGEDEKSKSQQALETKKIKFDFPKYVYDSFPTNQTLSNILNEKEKGYSYTTLRKTLVILSFFFHSIKEEIEYKEKDKDLEKRLKEFEKNTNTLLDECGYQRLYVRNPFDKMMYYCALQKNPRTIFTALYQCYKDKWDDQTIVNYMTE